MCNIHCRMEGKGTFSFADGSKYIGDMVDGQYAMMVAGLTG